MPPGPGPVSRMGLWEEPGSARLQFTGPRSAAGALRRGQHRSHLQPQLWFPAHPPGLSQRINTKNIHHRASTCTQRHIDAGHFIGNVEDARLISLGRSKVEGL